MKNYIAPSSEVDAFHCPHCNSYNHQEWKGISQTRDTMNIHIPQEQLLVLDAENILFGKITKWFIQKIQE